MNNYPNHTVFFDGVCNLCNGAVRYLLKYDKRQELRFCSLQSEKGRDFMEHTNEVTEEGKPSTLFFLKDGRIYKRSDAVLELAHHLGLPHSLAYPFRWLPRSLRDSIYRYVASRRYRWFGKRDYCSLEHIKNVDTSRFIDYDSSVYTAQKA